MTFALICSDLMVLNEDLVMFRYVDKNGCVFERRSYRVPGEKYPKAEAKCIGKMVDGKFVPNAFYRERQAREELEALKEELKKIKEAALGEEKK